jgi:hypothetical protein
MPVARCSQSSVSLQRDAHYVSGWTQRRRRLGRPFSTCRRVRSRDARARTVPTCPALKAAHLQRCGAEPFPEPMHTLVRSPGRLKEASFCRLALVRQCLPSSPIKHSAGTISAARPPVVSLASGLNMNTSRCWWRAHRARRNRCLAGERGRTNRHCCSC